MSIIYTVSIIALFVLTLLIKKKEDKIDAIKAITFNLILILAYNSLICYVLNLINIPITLISLSVINLLMIVCTTVKLIVDKKIQKYKLEGTSLIFTGVLIFTVFIIFKFYIQNINQVVYLTGDSQSHYIVAREFSENTQLTNKAKTNCSIGPTFMILAYTNEGIIFKVLQPYIGTLALFSVYTVFESILYAMTGLIFYFLAQKYCNKNIYTKILLMVFSILYVIGYPLSAWTSGFHYLIVGIMFVTAIVYAIDNIINDNEINFKYKVLVMFLLNFGIIFSYCLFCPFVYLAEFIYFIYKYWKNEKIKLLILILLTLVIPGIMGVIYLICPNTTVMTSGIAMEGYVYKNYWSNFILFIPFSIYCIYYCVKNKKINFENIILICLLCFIVILFVGTKMGKCSEYYFFKNYFPLWTLIIYTAVKGIIEFGKDGKIEKILSYVFISIYMLIFTISMIYIYTPQSFETHDNLKNTMEIYTLNKAMIMYMNPIVSNSEMELYEQMENSLEDNRKQNSKDEVIFITDRVQEVWINCLMGYTNGIMKDEKQCIENMKNNAYKYVIVINDTEAKEKYQRYLDMDKLNLVYENEKGKIYSK